MLSQLQYSVEAAEMKVIHFPGLVRVDGPGLRSVKKCCHDDGLVHLQFDVQVHTEAISHGGLQPAEGLTNFGDPLGNLVIIQQLPAPRPRCIHATFSCVGRRKKVLAARLMSSLQEKFSSVFKDGLDCCTKMKFTHLPFGGKTAPAIFQQTLNTILTGTEEATAYLDDIIVTGSNPD
ncbi:unnamed protein product [Schistocephalus solidus]|uniref:Reverse transcriptase domain-containing protein n=1 Tax=Schistocephalus solidus TaxID=70667 RepID=A0A183T8Q9_SCHSO|nr:unnamed protein product [Schistocephalus solidus]